MTTTTGALPFFERAGADLEFLPAEAYIAVLRSPNADVPAVRMTLPADLVDRTVLTGAQLSVWLSAVDGRLILDGAGVDNEALEAALAFGPMSGQTLLSLIEANLDPDHLAMEDDPVGDLSSLRAQLIEALAKVDGALARLRGS
jgi:hypothetical protein